MLGDHHADPADIYPLRGTGDSQASGKFGELTLWLNIMWSAANPEAWTGPQGRLVRAGRSPPQGEAVGGRPPVGAGRTCWRAGRRGPGGTGRAGEPGRGPQAWGQGRRAVPACWRGYSERPARSSATCTPSSAEMWGPSLATGHPRSRLLSWPPLCLSKMRSWGECDVRLPPSSHGLRIWVPSDRFLTMTAAGPAAS